MIDLWVKFVSGQVELAMDLMGAVFRRPVDEPEKSSGEDSLDGVRGERDAAGPGVKEEIRPKPLREASTGSGGEGLSPVPAPVEDGGNPRSADASVLDPGVEIERGSRTRARGASTDARAAMSGDILSFIEGSDGGATILEISSRMEMDRKSILPLLKTLVKKGRVDELLGRYYPRRD